MSKEKLELTLELKTMDGIKECTAKELNYEETKKLNKLRIAYHNLLVDVNTNTQLIYVLGEKANHQGTSVNDILKIAEEVTKANKKEFELGEKYKELGLELAYLVFDEIGKDNELVFNDEYHLDEVADSVINHYFKISKKGSTEEKKEK